MSSPNLSQWPPVLNKQSAVDFAIPATLTEVEAELCRLDWRSIRALSALDRQRALHRRYLLTMMETALRGGVDPSTTDVSLDEAKKLQLALDGIAEFETNLPLVLGKTPSSVVRLAIAQHLEALAQRLKEPLKM